MRVLFVNHDFLPKHPAGTEIYTFEVAKALVKRGHDVHVFATEKDIGLPNLTVHFREYEGLPVHELTNNLFYNDFRETWDYPHVVRSMSLLLDDLKPDVVHFMHLLYLSVGCVEEVARRGIPVLFTLHDYWLQCARYGQRIHANGSICHEVVPEICGGCLVDLKFKQSRGERALAKAIARLRQGTGINLAAPARRVGDLLKGRGSARKPSGSAASGAENAPTSVWRPPSEPHGVRALELAELVRERDSTLRDRLLPVVYRFLAPSRFLRERFLDWGIPPEQIDYCRTGIDLSAFEGFRRVPGERLRVAFIGTPAPHKGVHVLLEAWAQLSDAERAAGELCIWGNLDHNPAYIRRLQTLAEPTGAKLLGGLKRSEVPGALARTDVLVVPSVWYENSPLIILEALATKTPILVSDLGGMAELVEPGVTGFRFPVGDAAGLAQLLSRLFADRSELARLYPHDLHVKPVQEDARQFEELYLEALAHRADRTRSRCRSDA